MSSSGATRCHAHCCQPQYRRAPRPEAKAPRSPGAPRRRTGTPTPKRISTPWGRMARAHPGRGGVADQQRRRVEGGGAVAWRVLRLHQKQVHLILRSPCRRRPGSTRGTRRRPRCASPCRGTAARPTCRREQRDRRRRRAAERVGAGAAHVRQRGARRRRAAGSNSSTTPKLYDTGVLGRSGPKRARTKGTTRVSPADTARNASWWPSSQILMFWNESPDGGSAAAGAQSAGTRQTRRPSARTPLPQAGSLGATSG